VNSTLFLAVASRQYSLNFPCAWILPLWLANLQAKGGFLMERRLAGICAADAAVYGRLLAKDEAGKLTPHKVRCSSATGLALRG
jgi:hypothetical protein